MTEHEPSGEVRLRAVDDADLPIFLAHQDDPIAAAMAAFPTREPGPFYEHWAEIRADPAVVCRTIESDGVVVGDIVKWEEDDRHELGFWIDRGAWGRGIASAALGLMLEERPERPMHARVARHNVGAQRVLERNGFGRVGQTDSDGLIEDLYRLG